jgi:hypothetical protein
MMSDLSTPFEVHPHAFLMGAMQFRRAADMVYFREPAKEWIAPVQSPVYVLYAHVIELALKGFLRSAGVPTKKLATKAFGHDVAALYKRALELGLTPPADLAPHFSAVTRLTTRSNVDQAHRYWTAKNTIAPRGNWLRSVAHALADLAATRITEAERHGTFRSPISWGERGSRIDGPEHFNLPPLPEPPADSA